MSEFRYTPGFARRPSRHPGIVQDADGHVYVIAPNGTRSALTPSEGDTAGSFEIVNLKTDLGAEGIAFSTSGRDQQAFEIAATLGGGRVVYIPPGVYMAHEIPVSNVSRFVGDGRLNTSIFYNGQGGPGSCLFDVKGPGQLGSVVFAGLKLQGYASGMAGTRIAENIIRHRPNVGIDWGYTLRELVLMQCFGDAIYVPSSFVNWYARDLRFDGIGGYAISVVGDISMERRAFHLQDFTCDNAMGSTFEKVAKAEGYFDGVRWGRGFMRVRNCVDTTFHVQDGRLEFNKRLVVVDGRCSAFHSSMSISGFQTIELDNVKGFFQFADAGVCIHAPGGRTIVSIDGYSGISNGAKTFENGADTTSDILSSGPFFGATSMRGLTTAARGITIDAQRLEFRAAPPASGTHVYQRGDVIFNSEPDVGEPAGWTVTAPRRGFGRVGAPVLIPASAQTVAASPRVIVPDTMLRLLPVGAAIEIVGAAANGETLATIIVDVDIAAHAIVVADAPSVSLPTATIRQQAVTFSPWAPL